MHNVLFTVGLSNGETITEEKGDYQTITGELSPWQRLLTFIAKNDLKITSLALHTRDGRRWNLPSAGKHPRFHELTTAEKPVDFRMFRKAAMEGKNREELQEAPKTDVHTCIEATYEDGKRIQVWVDEETQASWSFVTYK